MAYHKEIFVFLVGKEFFPPLSSFVYVFLISAVEKVSHTELLVPVLGAIFNFLMVSSGIYLHVSRYIVQLLFLACLSFAAIY